MPRFFCDAPLNAGESLSLPETAARHVQVLRLQPGDPITLFNGTGGEWQAQVRQMGRSSVQVLVQAHTAIEREAGRAVQLAVGMPANERMDWLVEKATELGVAGLQPLHTAHSVLRLNAERAQKKRLHWQAVAQAACEQSGRNRVPPIAPVQDIGAWLGRSAGVDTHRCVLSLAGHTQSLDAMLAALPEDKPLLVLSGPEGGLSPAEDAQARALGFTPVSMGSRVLRAETAALAALVLAAR